MQALLEIEKQKSLARKSLEPKPPAKPQRIDPGDQVTPKYEKISELVNAPAEQPKTVGGRQRVDQKEIEKMINSKYQPPKDDVIYERTFEESKINPTHLDSNRGPAA